MHPTTWPCSCTKTHPTTKLECETCGDPRPAFLPCAAEENYARDKAREYIARAGVRLIDAQAFALRHGIPVDKSRAVAEMFKELETTVLQYGIQAGFPRDGGTI